MISLKVPFTGLNNRIEAGMFLDQTLCEHCEFPHVQLDIEMRDMSLHASFVFVIQGQPYHVPGVINIIQPKDVHQILFPVQIGDGILMISINKSDGVFQGRIHTTSIKKDGTAEFEVFGIDIDTRFYISPNNN